MKIKELITSPQLYVGLSTGAVAATAVSFIPGIFPIVAGVAGVIGFGAGLVGSSFERKPHDSSEADAYDVAQIPVSSNYLPENLRAQVLHLKKLLVLHTRLKTPMVTPMTDVLRDSQELFARIDNKLDSQAHRLAAVNYTDTLTKLNKALDEDYYLDIKKNPRLWSDPDERCAAVETAVYATANQLLRNIQQVNASQDIDYEVSLESLTNSMTSLEATKMTG